MRVQLGGALLFGTLLPFTVGALVTPRLAQLPLFDVSLTGSVVAITLGFYFIRSLINFPGISASYYVLPIFTSTFAATFATFFLFRLDYSRPLLVASYVISVIWFYLVYSMLQRRQRLRFAVVPFGRVDTLLSLSEIGWTMLDTPRVPRGCSGIAADFLYDLAPEWEQFLAESALNGLPVYHYKQLRQSLTGQVEIEHLSENSLGSLIPNNSFLTVKLIIDAVVAFAALIVLLPVLIVVALLIKLDSRGPVVFKQYRVGYRGGHFRVWKFRTMYQRAGTPGESVDSARTAAITLDSDRRITRVGRILRRTRLDELPQLVNVVRGEMSLIGPRPEADVLSRWYQAEIPFYRYRHIVRPGISGWAQVNQGHVAELEDVLKKLNYDFYYISNFSFWLDILIIAKTLRTMMTGHGSR